MCIREVPEVERLVHGECWALQLLVGGMALLNGYFLGGGKEQLPLALLGIHGKYTGQYRGRLGGFYKPAWGTFDPPTHWCLSEREPILKEIRSRAHKNFRCSQGSTLGW